MQLKQPTFAIRNTENKILRLTLHNKNNANNLDVFKPYSAYNLILQLMA